MTSVGCTTYSPGFYGVWNPTIGSGGGLPIIPGFLGIFGNSMYVDAPPAATFALPAPHQKIWGQTVNIINGVTYSLQFNSSGNFNGFVAMTAPSPTYFPLRLQFMVDGVFVGSIFPVTGIDPGQV